MSEFKRQIPNLLSVLRIPIAFVACYFAFTMKPLPLLISLLFFLLASATDFLDGYLARKWNIVSNFGKIIDPIADKILILGVLVVFTYNGVVPLVITSLIFIREFALTIIRLLLLPKKIVLAARFSGKLKTISQIGVLIAIYLLLIFVCPIKELLDSSSIAYIFVKIIVVWAAFITLYSGAEFIYFNRRPIRALMF